MSDVSPNSSAFWSPAVTPRRGKRARPDAVLKNLRPEAQEVVAGWCQKPMDRDADDKPIKGTGGPLYALAKLAEVAREFSLPWLAVSSRVVYKFFAWWELEQDLEASFEREKQVLAKTGDARRAREAGETMLARLGLAKKSPDLIEKAASIADSRRRLDMEQEFGKTKARQKDQQLAQSAAALKLDREKFEASMRTKLEAAYAALAEELKRNPKAHALFRDAMALLPAA